MHPFPRTSLVLFAAVACLALASCLGGIAGASACDGHVQQLVALQQVEYVAPVVQQVVVERQVQYVRQPVVLQQQAIVQRQVVQKQVVAPVLQQKVVRQRVVQRQRIGVGY